MTPPNRRNYYRILHVQPDAPDTMIRTAYRTLMQKLRQHPDLGGDGATATLINEAYAVLSDPDRRAAYDMQLGHPQRTAHPPPPATPPSPAGAHCAYCQAGIPARTSDAPGRRCQVCGSPLSPPPDAQRFNAARRAFDRRTLAAPVEYFLRQESGPRPASG
jgi:curved DNA-binding protein CbpA